MVYADSHKSFPNHHRCSNILTERKSTGRHRGRANLLVCPIFRRTSEAMFSHRALSTPDARIAALARRLRYGENQEVFPTASPYRVYLSQLLNPQSVSYTHLTL